MTAQPAIQLLDTMPSQASLLNAEILALTSTTQILQDASYAMLLVKTVQGTCKMSVLIEKMRILNLIRTQVVDNASLVGSMMTEMIQHLESDERQSATDAQELQTMTEQHAIQLVATLLCQAQPPAAEIHAQTNTTLTHFYLYVLHAILRVELAQVVIKTNV